MVIIGICGGVASGKSSVSQQFQQLGAAVLDADRLGHEVLRQEKIKQAIHDRWADAVFDSRGEVDRRALAQRVFAPTDQGARDLEYLESLTHPEIGRMIRRRITELEIQQKVPAAVLDAPVMFKAGWDRYCHWLIYVDAPKKLRLERALRRGWTVSQFTQREALQEPPEWKRRRAHFIIDNSGSLQQTFSQVRDVWRALS
jgi:dephospho-CoA kinase